MTGIVNSDDHSVTEEGEMSPRFNATKKKFPVASITCQDDTSHGTENGQQAYPGIPVSPNVLEEAIGNGKQYTCLDIQMDSPES